MPRKRPLEISVGPVGVHNTVACFDEGVKQENSGKQQTNKLNLLTPYQNRSQAQLAKIFSLSGRIHYLCWLSCFTEKSIKQ